MNQSGDCLGCVTKLVPVGCGGEVLLDGEVEGKFTGRCVAVFALVKNPSRIRRFPSAQDGLRAMAERAPQAEALAVSWMEWVRPVAMRVYALRRRIATVTVAVLACLLFVHVLLGANGMVVYKQKRMEYEALQKQLALEQKENDLYTQRIQGLKSDTKAIEKEAREQLHYARPGEYVYVPPAPAAVTPAANHSATR